MRLKNLRFDSFSSIYKSGNLVGIWRAVVSWQGEGSSSLL